jgi:FkbH-like protein
MLLMARLRDKYGDYGRIGLMLVEENMNTWNIKLLLMSCRVMTYGIGSVMLSYIINLARKNDKTLFAEYRPNERNRMMNITYKFMNFKDHEKKDQILIFKHDLSDEYGYPDHMKITLP